MSRGNPEMQPGGWLGAGGWRPGASQGPRAGSRGPRAGGGWLGAGGPGAGGRGAGGRGPTLDWGWGQGLRAVYGGREGGAGGWGLGHGCDTPATHANASRTLANASRTLRERFSDDPWSTIGPLDPNL